MLRGIKNKIPFDHDNNWLKICRGTQVPSYPMTDLMDLYHHIQSAKVLFEFIQWLWGVEEKSREKEYQILRIGHTQNFYM